MVTETRLGWTNYLAQRQAMDIVGKQVDNDDQEAYEKGWDLTLGNKILNLGFTAQVFEALVEALALSTATTVDFIFEEDGIEYIELFDSNGNKNKIKIVDLEAEVIDLKAYNIFERRIVWYLLNER